MRTNIVSTAALFLALALPPAAAAQTPAPLFNGRDLAGWVQRGGAATFKVEGNEIVGTAVPGTPNSFLCTEKTYGDFVLEFEFKVDPRLNSGVQIRSESFDQPREVTWQGRTIRIPAGRVHGYQVEIDPDTTRGRMWSGGIFDEARREWLYPSGGETGVQGRAFSEQGRRIFKPGDWNRVRVEAVGNLIRTWLNGEPCAYLRDDMTPRGFIALQVHGIGNDRTRDGAQVRWRNLTITELASGQRPPPNYLHPAEHAAGWRLLWDGITTAGWRGAFIKNFPAEGWEIKDGTLKVADAGGAESARGGDIVTRERYADFDLQLEFKITPGANSGIKYFSQPELTPITGDGAPAAVGSAIGPEYQILDDERHPDAKQGRDGNRTVASLYDLMPANAGKQANPVGEWNFARVVARGARVEHWLNGRKVLEYERGSEAFRELVRLSKYRYIPNFGEWPDGHILLQEHGDAVSFRNIKLRGQPVR